MQRHRTGTRVRLAAAALAAVLGAACASPPEALAGGVYFVKEGDSLEWIAGFFGVEADRIRAANRLGRDVRPGDRIRIPAPPAADAAPPGPGQPPPGPAATGVIGSLVGFAKTMLGIPYRFGGTTLRGIDCSAFVQRVFGVVDTPLPRTAREQFAVGAPVPREEIRPGDLVFFRTYASFPSHVGIYLGEDLFIHASSVFRAVRIDSLERPYFVRRFLGARRVVAGEAQELACAGP